MKRSILVLSLWCGSAALAQGFEVANPEPQPGSDAEFDERAPVQEVAAAGSQQWQPMPPPPPTEQEIEQNPMVNETAQPPAQPPTQEQFEQELSPYGKWIDIPGQGRVWQPDATEVGEDFVPYSTGGTWGYTDYGWNFNTGWSWGWAPFHYGRWWRHPSYGWVWWPQYTWGPSWVDWRCAGGYVGWAPLGPPWAAVQFGLGVPGWSFAARTSLWHPYVSYHQIFPRYAGGRYSWYHAPAFRTNPAWNQVSRSWHQPAWHSAATWHGGVGHTYTRQVSGTPVFRGGSRGVRVGGTSHSSGGFHGGGGHHR
jgi:hypothetical protein